MMQMIAPLLTGYLIGSIPFGLLLSVIGGYGDIRAIGSGNIGATNVLRTGNKKLALLTLLLDGGKGATAVLLCHAASLDYPLPAVLAAVLGHCFPVWLTFKGGKGVATALGGILAALPYTGGAAILIWLCVFWRTRISSLSAIISLGLAPVVTYFFYGEPSACITALICAIVIARHHQNIRRLLKGAEPTFGSK